LGDEWPILKIDDQQSIKAISKDAVLLQELKTTLRQCKANTSPDGLSEQEALAKEARRIFLDQE